MASSFSRFLLFAITLLLFVAAASGQSTCSATQPCAEGCCSKFGNCGFGADFCSPDNCVGSCDSKSECDPGWGPQYSASEKCPLNVCCSKFGFCGTTSDFCGSSTVKSPSCSGTSAEQRTIGYYEGWATTRSCNNMAPEQIKAEAYTHLNFAFAFVDPSSFAVAPMSNDQIQLYQRTTALKNTNPGLQVWISIGGWSMNDPDQPTASTFSQLAGSASAQQAFITSLIKFMGTYGFDGVDIDWEYPVAPERSGKPEDFANYVSFLRNVREALRSTGHAYGLSITIPSSYWYMRNFDIASIAQNVDWLNLMSYDLHGTWDSTDVYIGSIVNAHTNLTEIDQALQLLWRNNIDPSKVNLGLGFYGRSFTLANPSCSDPGCPFTSGGNPGPCTGTAGVLSYSEISDIIAAGGTTVKTDTTAAVQIVTWGGNQWVSYDNADTLGMKIQYANSRCLGGSFVWAVSLDNNNGDAAKALSQTTNKIGNSQKSVSLGSQQSTPGCVISDCAAKPVCPAGKSAVQQTNGNVVNSIIPGCRKGQSRTYCCPSNDLPTCHWIGSARLCLDQTCPKGEIVVATDSANCWFNAHKTLCCSKTKQQIAFGQCGWENSCTLSSKCSDGSTPAFTASSIPGGSLCFLGTYKYCCPEPPPITSCSYSNGFFAPFYCSGKCPSDKIEIYRSSNGCLTGSRPVCCTAVIDSSDPLIGSFQEAVKNYKANPTCSANDIIWPGHPNKGDTNFKRSISNVSHISFDDPEHRQHLTRSLQSLEARGFSASGGTVFVDLVALMSLGSNSYNRQLQQIWDDEIGASFGFPASNFPILFETFPHYDPLQLTLDTLCNIDSAANHLASAQTETQLCQFPTGVSVVGRRSIFDAKPKEILGVPVLLNDTVFASLVKRPFWSDNTRTSRGPGAGQAPYTGYILQAIVNGRVPLLYIRQLNYAEGTQMNLEVVYDLRQLPDLRENPADIMAVFHFHVIGLTDNGVPQIEFFHVYHAQGVYNSFGEWRANGYDSGPGGSNERAVILDCPIVTTANEDLPGNIRGVWVPGEERTIPANAPGAQLIHQFGLAILNNVFAVRTFHPTNPPANSFYGSWDFDHEEWVWGNTRESNNFGAGGLDVGASPPADMSPGAGWPQINPGS